MTAPTRPTPEEVAQLGQRALDEVSAMVKRQWAGGAALRLTIPVDEHHDSDCIITTALLALLAQAQRDAEEIARLRAALNFAEQRQRDWREMHDAATQCVRALEAALRRFMDAYDVCEGNRGRFSCSDPHDLRCPKSRAATPEQWRGEWRCECGAEELMAAYDNAGAALAPPAEGA